MDFSTTLRPWTEPSGKQVDKFDVVVLVHREGLAVPQGPGKKSRSRRQYLALNGGGERGILTSKQNLAIEQGILETSMADEIVSAAYTSIHKAEETGKRMLGRCMALIIFLSIVTGSMCTMTQISGDRHAED